MPLAAGSRLGPYEIVSPLGAGGMGEVYRARDTRLGREVAIKVLPADRLADQARRARFVQEARAASALNHPHIVTIYEIESAEGFDFIVMELVGGKTLDALIPRHGMRLGEVLRIAIPLADALAAAHGAWIVHRDLKPANVMVTPEGVVKVLDFGLAKLTQAEEAATEDATTLDARAKLSRPGTVAGTPAYMSPEQASGGKVDARSDIFSFGAVLYEMVTGRRPFGGGSTAEILASLLKEQPKPPSEVVPDVPKELERIILRCLRKEPERRFQHMTDLRVDLQEVKEESDSGLTAPGVRAPRRRGLWVAAGLVGALAVVMGGFLLWRSRRPEPPAPYLVPLTSTPGTETHPTFSPDGDQVAFAWDGEKGDNTDIYVKMVGSGEAHRLTTDPADDTFPSWSPDGRQIAFVRSSAGSLSGTIHVISPLGGADRKVSDQPVGPGPLSWSPDSRWLATGWPFNYAMKSDLPRGIRLVDVSSGETRSVTAPTEPTYHSGPTLSPDGRRLAYASCSGWLRCHLEVSQLKLDGVEIGTARRVTRGGMAPGGLAWTRDGTSLVYSSGGRLWRVSIQGDEPPRQIEIAGFGAVWPAIAASRDRLAFVHSLAHAAIYRFEVGRPAEAVVASSWNPHLSPDGSRVAFESTRGGGGDEIWLAAADGSNPTQLTHGPGLWQGSPRWSPDGRRIAFDSYGEDGHSDIWTIDADGGSLRRLTSSPAGHGMPTWSHDGRFVYFISDRGGAETIWRVPAAGGPEQQVTHTGGGRCEEAADGQTLYFQRAITGAGSSPLLAVSPAGGQERTVIDCVSGWSYALGRAGVYHEGCGGDPRAVPLLLRDTATSRDRLLGTLEGPAGLGLTASADGKLILYDKPIGEGSDLVLIENFR
ncbi:MAG TPA: protein kinase [Vicinamibacteria bacterium]|nr:protein kinase [Vicinamibacteria bacterium]